jgi:hypothetical protein
MPSPAETAPPPTEADLDLDLLAYVQTLTPAQRLKRMLDALELVLALRTAGIRLHGFDPRSPEKAD